MYNARERVAHETWLDELDRIADQLDLSANTRSIAVELFLDDVPNADRSKRAVLAASVYAAALIAGEERSQRAVGAAADVSRLAIQQRWKEELTAAGFEPPGW